MTAELHHLIDHRLEQAESSLVAARLQIERGLGNPTMHSIYYTMFFSVCALLATKEFQIKGEGGVIGKFEREFIKTGLIPPEVSLRFKLATQIQHDMDFKAKAAPDAGRLRELLVDAESFLATTKLFLAKQ
jgi:uncharacterized protein (UPF0332 family)